MKNSESKNRPAQKINEILEAIARDRTRTNLLNAYEQKALAYLVQHIPSWISSDMLTAIGFIGNIIVFVSFILASYLHMYYLLFGVLGFIISWFGDSLDGRVAYFRNKPRNKYGFTLDITMDWISIILIGYGFIIYAEGRWELLGYSFVVMYGWEMIIALIRFKITGKYSIDAGKLGPTETRIAISAILIMEVFLKGSLMYSALVIVIVLFIVNVFDTRKMLLIADEIDTKERAEQTGKKEL